jgi:hypothetical protein
MPVDVNTKNKISLKRNKLQLHHTPSTSGRSKVVLKDRLHIFNNMLHWPSVNHTLKLDLHLHLHHMLTNPITWQQSAETEAQGKVINSKLASSVPNHLSPNLPNHQLELLITCPL